MAKVIIQVNESSKTRYDIMGLTYEQMSVIRKALVHARKHAADPEDKTFIDKDAEKILKAGNEFDDMYANPIKV